MKKPSKSNQQTPKNSQTKEPTHFESTSQVDNRPVLIPYPSPEQLAQLVVPLHIANPIGRSHATTALSIWEQCCVTLAQHRASQKQILAADEDHEQWRIRIKLSDDDVFPMDLDSMLKRQCKRTKQGRMNLFKRHLRDQPVINPNGSIRIDPRTGNLLLRSEKEVEKLISDVSSIKSPTQYYFLAQAFQKWLATLKSQRGKKGGQARAAKKNSPRKT